MTSAMRQAAIKANNGEYQSLWAGQAFDKIRVITASDLMTRLSKEMEEG